jgi:hypothetical protein
MALLASSSRRRLSRVSLFVLGRGRARLCCRVSLRCCCALRRCLLVLSACLGALFCAALLSWLRRTQGAMPTVSRARESFSKNTLRRSQPLSTSNGSSPQPVTHAHAMPLDTSNAKTAFSLALCARCLGGARCPFLAVPPAACVARSLLCAAWSGES